MCKPGFHKFFYNCLALSSLTLFFYGYPLVVDAEAIIDVMGSVAPCYDTDGDGYGWNGSANCPPFLGTVGGQVARLISEEGNIENFGSNVVIEGDRMLIGDGGRNVFLLQREADNQWSLDAALAIDDPVNIGNTYIYNFALQGDTIILANETAYSDVPIPGTSNSASRQTGAVYVFKESNGSWTQQAKLTPSESRGYDRFGDTIALAGELLLVSAPDKEREDAWRGPGVSPVPQKEGAVYVFNRNSQGQWTEEAIIERDDEYGNFGRSINLDDNGIAIIGSNYGISPYVFRRVAWGDWREVSRLESIEATRGPVRSFALDSETLLVGTGALFVGFQVHDYINNGDGTFTQTGQTLSDRSSKFAIRGNTALVERLPADLSLDSDIEIFKRSTAGEWQLQNTLKSSLDDRTSFGHSFSVSGNTVVVGAAANYNSLFKRGSVYVFDISQPNDGQRHDDSCIDLDGDGWGWNVTLNESCTSFSMNFALCIDTDGDGWGWNGTDSCRVIASSSSTTTTHRCDYTDADLYDGWGWNPIAGESCPPRDPSILEGCDYTQSAFHDGWGWNAATQQSCAPMVGL